MHSFSFCAVLSFAGTVANSLWFSTGGSVRRSSLFESAGHIPMPLHLECRPQIFESTSDDWHHVFISRPGGFLSVEDVELVVKKRPREVLTVSPTKGAKVPKYIVDEKMGPM
jgi:hypothetical protein